WKEILGLCRAVPRPDPQAQGYRHDRQSSGVQGRRCPRGDRSARCDASLSAQILAGPEPDRDAFQQAQGLSAQGRRTNNSAPAPPDRQIRAHPHYPRSLQLFQACRLCVKSTGICSSFPIDRMRQAIQPTSSQSAALDDLAAASSKASSIVAASCPSESPLTPLARLDAVEQRLDAMMQAIQIVRPALALLHDSLSDEQKQRLDALGTEESHNGGATAAAGSTGASTLATICDRQAASFTKLPVQEIEEIVKPKDQQQTALENLKQASAQAADELKTSCAAQPPATPVARLEAASNRLQALVQAVKTVRPTLGAFY